MLIWAWIARYIGHTILRFHVRKTGKTAYEESTDATYESEMADFGESVMIKEAREDSGEMKGGRVVRKADSPWIDYCVDDCVLHA